VVGNAVTFGITGYNYAPGEVINFAQALEELGFDTLWWGEHYVIPGDVKTPHPTGDSDDNRRILADSTRLYDLYCLLGAVAATTTTLKLGTAITILPLNPPLLLARSTATLHDVSSGRFLLSTNAG
jgi:alkanesulfonate monooxygenase SsuD/methylene tetrahydromethanopterin reductase-like flavin-dependent oxidoreductase (luciferase family)